MKSSAVTWSVPFEKKISRLFLFRPLWLALEIWILFAWSIWICIIRVLHFWYMLVLGERHKKLWEMQVHFMRHCIRWQAYLQNLSSGRPKFIED